MEIPGTYVSPVLIVAPLPFISKRTRLIKISRLYQERSESLEFWGWCRSSSEERDSESIDGVEVNVRTLLCGGGYAQRRLLLFYPLWVIKVVLAMLLAKKPRVVHAVGFDSAFPVALASLFRRKLVLVFDDADRMSSCLRLPRLVVRLFAVLERWTARRAQVHIIPGRGRYPDGLPCSRTVVLKNTPSRLTIDMAMAINVERACAEAELIIYVNGWIGETRGAPQVDALSRMLEDDPRVHFLAAGRLTGQAANDFSKRENVTYLGEVTNELALAHYRVVDLVLTYYDPKVPINRFAEPNKWGDCVAFGVPFVSNKEVVTSQPYIDDGVAFFCDYSNVAALGSLVAKLLDQPELLESTRQRMLLLQSSQQDFDSVFIDQVIEPIGRDYAVKN